MNQQEMEELGREEFVRNLNHNYLRLRLSEKPEEKKFQYCILQRGGIGHLLPCDLRYINEDAYLYYDITSLQNLSQIFQNKKVDRKWFGDFLWGMQKVQGELCRFLLEQEHLIWNPEYVFQDYEKNDFYFQFIPYENHENSFKNLMDFIIEHLDYQDESFVEFFYGIYEQFLQIGSDFLVEKIHESFEHFQEAEKQGGKKKGRQIKTQVEEEAPQCKKSQMEQESSWYRKSRAEQESPRSRKSQTEQEGSSYKKSQMEQEGPWSRKSQTEQESSWHRRSQTEQESPWHRKNQAEQDNSWNRKSQAEQEELISMGERRRNKNERGRASQRKNVGPEENSFYQGAEDSFGETPKKEKKGFWGLFTKKKVDRFRLSDQLYEIEGEQEMHPTYQPQEVPMMIAEPVNPEEEYGKTMFFENEESQQDRGLYRENGELLVRLTEFPFVVGKKKDEVQYAFSHPSVSRIHARFLYENSAWFIEDVNSTNGTFKNGLRLRPYEKRKLDREDEIRFGSLTFTFR